jgi:hypothetical protein
LRRHLRKLGALSLLEDDLQKVAEGVTTIAEFQTVGGMGFFAREPAVELPARTLNANRVDETRRPRILK